MTAATASVHASPPFMIGSDKCSSYVRYLPASIWHDINDYNVVHPGTRIRTIEAGDVRELLRYLPGSLSHSFRRTTACAIMATIWAAT